MCREKGAGLKFDALFVTPWGKGLILNLPAQSALEHLLSVLVAPCTFPLVRASNVAQFQRATTSRATRFVHAHVEYVHAIRAMFGYRSCAHIILSHGPSSRV